MCPAADAAFVASFSIPGDDKVYFFFEETADEFDFFERLLVPRVARVCKVGAGMMMGTTAIPSSRNPRAEHPPGSPRATSGGTKCCRRSGRRS